MCPEHFLEVDMKNGLEGEPGVGSQAGDALQEPEMQDGLGNLVF